MTNTANSYQMSGEFLRLALPLMSKYEIPVNPRNYALWYRYVSGVDHQLKNEVDKLLEDEQTLSDEILTKLYERYVSECDTNRFHKIKNDLLRLLAETGEQMAAAGHDSECFGSRLEESVKQLEDDTDIPTLTAVLQELILETSAMRESTRKLQAHFIDKTSEIEQLRKELDRAREEATRDPLTRLLNRRAFTLELEKQVEHVSEREGHLSLLMIDIDRFKSINDSYGHLVGDKVIRFIAKILEDSATNGNRAARYGGEEFALLLPDCPLADALKLAENVRAKIQRAKLIRSGTREALSGVTVSIGASCFRSGEAVADFIHRADEALYASKAGGRNRVSSERAA